MMARMGTDEFAEWIAFDRIETIRTDAPTWQIAQLTALTANINRDTKKRKEPYGSEDFAMFTGREPTPEQTADEQSAVARHITNMFGQHVRPRK